MIWIMSGRRLDRVGCSGGKLMLFGEDFEGLLVKYFRSVGVGSPGHLVEGFGGFGRFRTVWTNNISPQSHEDRRSAVRKRVRADPAWQGWRRCDGPVPQSSAVGGYAGLAVHWSNPQIPG